MAWYRIAENVLNAIANAINAKTGHTAPMTPVEMVSEIQSIPSGGGGEKVYTKLGEAVVSEPVHAINISFTEQMRNCEVLYLVINSLILSTSDWIYPIINNGQNYGYFDQAGTLNSATIAFAPIKKPVGTYKTTATSMSYNKPASPVIVNDFNTIGVTCYTTDVNITSGKIEVWGFV